MSSNRKRSAPTKVKVKNNSRAGSIILEEDDSSPGVLDDFSSLSSSSPIKEIDGLSGTIGRRFSGGSDRSSVDENQEHGAPAPAVVIKESNKGGGHSKHSKLKKSSSNHSNATSASSTITPFPLFPGSPVDWLNFHNNQPIGLTKHGSGHNSNNNSGKKESNFITNEKKRTSSPLSLTMDKSSNGSSNSILTNAVACYDENSSNGQKDDEEDDDDDSIDKNDNPAVFDPERLKAFNMFVRLFVDENLDRMVPISKQPKEKIQAIIDSCTRQFPEYAERARKRIRTYLKSCRRNKKLKDAAAAGGGIPGNGANNNNNNNNNWESTRPTPAHLTSAAAEQILAQACENESQNAKRMRMGLEPISQPLPTIANNNNINGMKDNSNSSSNSASPDPDNNKKSTTLNSAASTAATISAVVAAAAAAVVSTNAASNSTCSSLSSPSSAFSDVLGRGGALRTSGSPLASSLLSQIGNLNGNLSPAGVPLPIFDGTTASTLTNLSKLTGAEKPGIMDYSRGITAAAAAVVTGTNGLSMYKPNFSQSLTKPSHIPPFSPLTNGSNANVTANNAALGFLSSLGLPSTLTNGDTGPTDLSMKSCSSSSTSSKLSLQQQNLGIAELATVRQLIIGYRESAAFLLRSADELEQILLQQH